MDKLIAMIRNFIIHLVSKKYRLAELMEITSTSCMMTTQNTTLHHISLRLLLSKQHLETTANVFVLFVTDDKTITNLVRFLGYTNH